MATEQPEVETQTAPAVAANSQADITQQATTPTPTTRVKNPKRVAAGKKVAERTRIAREQQKKAAAEASVIIANNNAKATAAATPEPAPTTEVESPKNSGLSINQWIGIGGIAVGLAGIYYKREELKAAFKKIRPEPEPASVEPEPAHSPQGKGLTKMVRNFFSLPPKFCQKWITSI